MKYATYIDPRIPQTLDRFGYERTSDGLQGMLAHGVIDVTEFAATMADLIIVKAMRSAAAASTKGE